MYVRQRRVILNQYNVSLSKMEKLVLSQLTGYFRINLRSQKNTIVPGHYFKVKVGLGLGDLAGRVLFPLESRHMKILFDLAFTV